MLVERGEEAEETGAVGVCRAALLLLRTTSVGTGRDRRRPVWTVI
jgi:hypothetical protein